MRRLARPRNWIALLAGIAAGLFVWTLPPLPDWRVATPKGSVLHALSPAGRHVVTWRLDKETRTIEVWDRAAADREPISFAIPEASSWQLCFSPDGETLVFTENPGDVVKWFELASGNLVKSRRLPLDAIFFSPEGTLHYTREKLVYRIEDDQEVCRLPKEIDGLKADSRQLTFDQYVIYSNDGALQNERYDVLVYNALLAKEVARMTFPGNFMHVRDLSHDGKVLSAHGWAPGSGPWRTFDLEVMADVSGEVRSLRVVPGHHFRSLSPNGDLVVSYHPTERPDWLKKWLPLKEGDTTFVIADWRTGVERTRFRDMVHLEFSPDNEHLAVMQSDNVVAGYAWPLRPPWALFMTAMLSTVGIVWTVGWLWSRRFVKTSTDQ